MERLVIGNKVLIVDEDGSTTSLATGVGCLAATILEDMMDYKKDRTESKRDEILFKAKVLDSLSRALDATKEYQ